MSTCLREKELIRYYLGEGVEAQQAHVETCASCARRVGQLAQDMELIQGVLKAPPKLRRSRRTDPAGSYRVGLRWALATAAVVLAFVGGQRIGYRPLGHTVSAVSSSAQPDAFAILAASPNLGMQEMAGLENAPSSPGMYGLYVQEALTPASSGGDFLASFEDADFTEP